MKNIKFLKTEIIKFIDNGHPGWLLCSFKDAYSKVWKIEEKIPVLFESDFCTDNLPVSGFYISGKIISLKNGIALFRTETENGNRRIYADDGTSEFHVFAEQLADVQSN